MDHSGASEGPGPGRRPSSPSSGTPMGAQGSQRPKVKITPFHSSPIVSSDGALRRKRPGAAYGKLLTPPSSLFRDTPGRLTAPPVRERLAVAAGSPVEQTPSSGFLLDTTGAKAQASPLAIKVNEALSSSV